MTFPPPLPADRVPPPGTEMTQWVIYDHPSDHPDGFVLRAAYIAKGGFTVDKVAWKHPEVEALRAIVPPGLYRLPRFIDDDPAILEVWV